MEQEISLEKIEFMKGLYPQMKVWYNNLVEIEIKEKYGNFPDFWQDLEKWKYYTVLKKLYFMISDKKKDEKYNILELEKQVIESLNRVENFQENINNDIKDTDVCIECNTSSSSSSSSTTTISTTGLNLDVSVAPVKKRNRFESVQVNNNNNNVLNTSNLLESNNTNNNIASIID